MRLCIYLLLLFFLWWIKSGKAQNELWFFGSNASFTGSAGIDFSSGSPVANNVSSAIFYEAATVQSNGATLLFYSNAQTVYNSSHVVMANGSGLTGNVSSGGVVGTAAQGALSFPLPGSSDKYLLFTSAPADGNMADGIRWTEIDMSLNGGLGGVTANKDLLLTGANTVCEMLTAFSADGITVYVIGHLYNSDQFVVIPVTSAGPGAATYTSIGPTISGSTFGARGSIKISPDGSRLAMGAGWPTYIQLFDFDASTGVISNHVTPAATGATDFGYSFEWSSNSRYLFISNFYDASGGTEGIKVIDASTNAAIGSLATTQVHGNCTMGPDGVIYVSKLAFPHTHLGTITNPNLGTGATWSESGYALGGSLGNLGLPQQIKLPTALPVELTHFTAEYQNGQVLLRWITLSEINHLHFAIEYQDPGTGWITIGKLEGGEDSQSRKDYSFKTRIFNEGNSLFRLRQVDLNGSSELSKILSVQIPTVTRSFPNPSRGIFTICDPNFDPESLLIYHNSQIMGGEKFEISPVSSDCYQIRFLDAVPGLYLLQTTNFRHKVLVGR